VPNVKTTAAPFEPFWRGGISKEKDVGCQVEPQLMNSEIAIRVPTLLRGKNWLRDQSEKWNKDLTFLIREMRMITLLLWHPDVPWYAKLIGACTLGYLVSPFQIIPTFIPIIGQLDDLAVLFTGMKLLRALAPKPALLECESKAELSASARRNVIGAPSEETSKSLSAGLGV
jgi:uncharacterized membrane protein YkvA (DUF1232 family)